MKDEPITDYDVACVEIAAAATALLANGRATAGDRRHLARIRTLALWLHRFTDDPLTDYPDDSGDDECEA